MTVRGKIVNGVVVLEVSHLLPEGAEVVVHTVDDASDEVAALRQVLLKHAGKGVNLPVDLAQNHDHYAHGKPKP